MTDVMYPRVVLQCARGHCYSYPAADPNAISGPADFIAICDYCIVDINDFERHRPFLHGWRKKLQRRLTFWKLKLHRRLTVWKWEREARKSRRLERR